ncbi:hypothetical protein LUZ60_014212 [Juncus effusus]|nr:hypothetical protein LUZ60_014212 [Juncus effusus]
MLDQIKLPFTWIKTLSNELHWSFIYGVIITYGICQGFGGGLGGVATDFYWKDVQLLQPSSAQFYDGITNVPWMVKPVWGLFTDLVPVLGFRRRPYFIMSAVLGVISTLTLSLHNKLPVKLAVLMLTLQSWGVAISDVTIDALVARNSVTYPALAADMQSLCGFSASLGGLLGFSISGLLVHAMGPQGVIGLLCIPFALIFSVGMLLKETKVPNISYNQVSEKFLQAGKSMWSALKCPQIWRPCVYMYLSLTLSLDISVGMFYWYTDPTVGPNFSEGFIGFIYSIGSVGSLLGVLLYQTKLKDHPFRNILFWAQLLSCLSGMLDLIFILRLNLILHIPDRFFAVIDICTSKLVGNLKWMPLLVLSSKLCPNGIEGTFYALLMSIDNAGLLSSSWIGSILLHFLNVTRDEFGNLWIAVFVRNLLRLVPLAFLFLVPESCQNDVILPEGFLEGNCNNDDIELVSNDFRDDNDGDMMNGNIEDLTRVDSESVSLIER